MDKIDLIELLQSFLEEDAIVSRIFSYFCLKKNYNIALLNVIIINSSDEQIEYDRIEWKKDNTYQEVVFRNPEKYVPVLFSEAILIPEPFSQFLKSC